MRQVIAALCAALPLFLGMFGSRLFSRWDLRSLVRSQPDASEEQKQSIFAVNDRKRFAVALQLLLIAVVAIVAHAFLSSLGYWPGWWGDYMLVCLVCVLREFARPLTTKALRDRVVCRAEHLVATCSSIAVAIARSSHFLAAAVFLVVGLLIRAHPIGGDEDLAAHNLESKVIVEVLTFAAVAALSAVAVFVVSVSIAARNGLGLRASALLVAAYDRIRIAWRSRESRIQLVIAAFVTCLVMSKSP